MKFDIMNRWTGKVQLTAEIDCGAESPRSVKLGMAVLWAYLRDADLTDADLTDADLRGAYLRDAYLRGADLRGADLTDADLRGAYLRGAYLRDAYLRDAYLTDADLRGADLRYADLWGANLRDANLRDADLWGADLTDANLTDAKFGEAPKIPSIHSAVYEAATKSDDALDMSEWHTCATTHCRAGWVVTLAGEAGAELEERIGTPAAALAIYAASDPVYLSRDGAPDFYCDNETALADMKRLAEMEQV